MKRKANKGNRGRARTTGEPIRMKKLRSPHIIIIQEDPEDSHFMNVSVQKQKTGVTVENHYILTSDRDQWIDLFKNEGFNLCE